MLHCAWLSGDLKFRLIFDKLTIHVVKKLSTHSRLVISRVIKSTYNHIHPTSITGAAEWVTGNIRLLSFLLAEFTEQHSLHSTCGRILRFFLSFYLVLNLNSACLPSIFWGQIIGFLVLSKSRSTSLTLVQSFINL